MRPQSSLKINDIPEGLDSALRSEETPSFIILLQVICEYKYVCQTKDSNKVPAFLFSKYAVNKRTISFWTTDFIPQPTPAKLINAKCMPSF